MFWLLVRKVVIVSFRPTVDISSTVFSCARSRNKMCGVAQFPLKRLIFVTSSSDDLAGKLRGSYGLVANFWPSPRASHGEIARVDLDMLRWSVVSADKLATNMEIGEQHDTTRPTFSVRQVRQPIALDCYHNVISDVTVYKHSTWRVHSYFYLLT